MVLQISFAYPIDIVVYGDGGVDAMLRFEGAFRYIESNGAARDLDASKFPWEDVAVVPGFATIGCGR